jgi:hypothetical protein
MAQWNNGQTKRHQRQMQRHASLASLEGDLFGEHWNVLRSSLPLYQAITMVDVGDGTTTSFCYNAWHNEDTLDERFPAIHSHTQSLHPQKCLCGTGLCLRHTWLEPVCATPFKPGYFWVQPAAADCHSEFQTTLSDTRDKRRGPLLPRPRETWLRQPLSSSAVQECATTPCCQVHLE